jgi:hypothetical protein
VGFLSEAELAARSTEATSDVPEANEADPERGAAPATEPTPETYITIKRAPRT